MKLGFIGTGNMASAIMGGIISKGVIPADEIIGADLFAPGREHAAHLHQIFLLGAQFFRRFVLFVLPAVFLHGTFLPFVVAAPCSVGPGAPVYAQFGPRKA